MYVSVATFALSAILNSDMIKNPELWSVDRMTAAGRAFVESNDMSSFLQLDLTNPFFTPNKQPTWHTVNSPSQWRFLNLEKFVGLDFALDPFFSGSDYFYVLFYVALGAAAVVIIAFCLVSLVWHGLHSRTVFLKLAGDAQLIVCIHSAFAFILAAQLVPYTVFVLPVWFGPNMLDQLQQHYVVPFTCVIMHGLLYVLEGCVRSSIRTSQLLLWHHLLWFVMIFIAAFKKDVFAIKLDFILDYFVCWEFALYICLVAHRLQASLRLQKVLLILAGLTYGVSRAVQAALLLGLFILSGERMRAKPAIYWVTFVLSVVLVILQTYTGWIYWAMWKRSSNNRKQLPLTGDSDTESVVSSVQQ